MTTLSAILLSAVVIIYAFGFYRWRKGIQEMRRERRNEHLDWIRSEAQKKKSDQ